MSFRATKITFTNGKTMKENEQFFFSVFLFRFSIFDPVCVRNCGELPHKLKSNEKLNKRKHEMLVFNNKCSGSRSNLKEKRGKRDPKIVSVKHSSECHVVRSRILIFFSFFFNGGNDCFYSFFLC